MLYFSNNEHINNNTDQNNERLIKLNKKQDNDYIDYFKDNRIKKQIENNEIVKIDWHNYKQINEDKKRKGPGEQGLPVSLLPEELNDSKVKSLFNQNGFQGYISDKISLDRALNDIRHPDCKKIKYRKDLAKVSIIIPFHQEHLSVLLRSVHSIIRQTPPQLLEEIILVDDFSKKGK